MTTITGNAQRDAEQRLDSVDHHLTQLRALIASGTLDLGQSPDASAEPPRDYESVVAETFGRWVLDLLGLGDSDPSDAVRVARTQLVGALSKQAEPGDTLIDELRMDEELNFVDIFAGDDLVDAPDEELGVKPIVYQP